MLRRDVIHSEMRGGNALVPKHGIRHPIREAIPLIWRNEGGEPIVAILVVAFLTVRESLDEEGIGLTQIVLDVEKSGLAGVTAAMMRRSTSGSMKA